MLRRSFITVAVAACTMVPILAQERATIVLTNGQRYSGVLTYPRGDNSIVDDRLHLAASGEQAFPISDVAVIDFAGGTPPATEVRALPEGGGVMIMRDGAAVRGNLHNIIRGGVVQWVNEGGERRNYDGSLVRRLYLNSDNARTTFLRGAPANSVGTAGDTGLSAASVRVNGNEQWVDTGIEVRRGDRIQINASGQVQYAAGARAANANGQREAASGAYPVPMMGAGGLIARVGESAPFAVGAGSREFTMPGDGRLFLGINDDDVSDNSGAYAVAIRRR
jgi:hypothetical protein